jgi:AAA domain-containing protein
VKPTVRELFEEIRYQWAEPEPGVQLSFTRLRETDAGAVRGMLTVDQMNGQYNGPGGHIWWAMVTLTTATDRKILVAKLERAVPRPDGWEIDVDRTFQDCWQRHTRVPDPIRLADVLDVPDEVEFLFEPVLPEGQITLLLADQGSTKSYLMLYLGACTALDHPSVFGRPKRPGPVLFFDWEVDERVARRRLNWICRGLGVGVPSNLYYVNMSDRGRLFDRIRDMRTQVQSTGAVLVAVDSLTFATGGDLNSPEYAAPTMSAIGALGVGVTKLVSSHPNKRDRNASADEISVIGSGLFEFRARAIWHMKREQRRGSRFGVSMTTRKPFDGAPNRSLAYRMVFDNHKDAVHFEPLRIEDVPDLEAQVTTRADKIRQLLRRKGKLDTIAIAETLGLSANEVRTECGRMADVFPLAAGGRGRGQTTTWGLGEPNATTEELPWWNPD